MIHQSPIAPAACEALMIGIVFSDSFVQGIGCMPDVVFIRRRRVEYVEIIHIK
jgi:hypothetical protein